MHGDDLRGELADKLGVAQSGNPEAMLQSAENELTAGNAIEAKKLFKDIIDITGANAIRYEGQSQHRAAAQEFYLQAVAFEHMEQTNERDTNYSKVIDGLLAYTKTAMQFNENEKGITAATLAGLVCIVSGNNHRATDIYNQHVELVKGKQNETGLAQLLWSLGYLLEALKNTNVEALSNAQNYISKDLTPMLTTSKLTGFSKLMVSVVKYTQNVIESRIKMPKMQIETQIPKDLLFNEIFEIKLDLLNTGEGEASNLALSVEIPSDFEILNGKTEVSYNKVNASAAEQVSFNLRYQTATQESEVTQEVKGALTFTDMLGNTHKQYFGPLAIELRSTSKSSQYENKLNAIKAEYDSIEMVNIDETLKMLVPSLQSLFNDGREKVENQISEKEFDNVNYALEHLQSVVDWQKEFFSGDEVSTNIANSVNNQIAKAEEKINAELSEKYQKEKENALQEQILVFNKEKDGALEAQKSEIQVAHEAEINNLKEEHFKEIGKLNQVHENKLNKLMAEQEQSLENKFVQEMNVKSDEFEKALRDIQTQHEEELDTERNQLKEDLRIKSQHDLDSLRETKEEEIRKLKEAHEEEIENTIQTQKTKLNKEKEDAIEQSRITLEREMTTEFEKKLDEMKKKLSKDIELRDAKIMELERQIRDLKSSSS